MPSLVGGTELVDCLSINAAVAVINLAGCNGPHQIAVTVDGEAVEDSLRFIFDFYLWQDAPGRLVVLIQQ